MSRLAQQLWQARVDGTVVALEDIVAPASMQEAYAVQAEIARLSGHATVGFKVGSTSVEAQRALGTTEPGSAPVLAPYLHQSPAEVTIAPLHMPAVEGEFAFRLGRDLPPRSRTYERDEVAAAVEAVTGAIEIVGTRFAGGLAGKGRLLTTADGGVNIGLVVGASTTAWRDLDLKAHRVSLTVNGEERGSGTGARALGDPMNVLAWLANRQVLEGRNLRTGDIISTGTCTGLIDVRPGQHVEADFGSLGRVEVALR